MNHDAVIEQADFRANKLFEGIPVPIVDRLSEIPRPLVVEAGTMIFDEGEPGHDLYLIVNGSVLISKRGRRGQQEPLSHLNANDFFGEMALFDASPRSARATAVERTVLGRVDMTSFRRMLDEAPTQLHLNMTRWAISMLRENDQMLIEQLLATERLSLIGAMAAMMIHDFKNPISVIRNATEMLEEKAADDSAVQLTAMINRSVDWMLAMIQDLLDYSRGNTNLSIEVVPISYILAELEEQALKSMEARGIVVERSIQLDGNVRLDAGRLLRALLNIIKNANEVMKPGCSLRLSVRREDGWDTFVISDTGPGIREDLLPRIFEPFVSSGKAKGTGLGLTIAKSAVEAHGGTISVSTLLGVGTTFTVRIPAASV
jgi:signal transduction histidine kinase